MVPMVLGFDCYFWLEEKNQKNQKIIVIYLPAFVKLRAVMWHVKMCIA